MKNIIMITVTLLFLGCKKEKAINQFGNWDLERKITRIYIDTDMTESSTHNLEIELYENYTGLHEGEIFKWILLGNHIYFDKINKITLPTNTNEEIPFTIITNESDFQVWNSQRIFIQNEFYQDEQWTLYEK